MEDKNQEGGQSKPPEPKMNEKMGRRKFIRLAALAATGTAVAALAPKKGSSASSKERVTEPAEISASSKNEGTKSKEIQAEVVEHQTFEKEMNDHQGSLGIAKVGDRNLSFYANRVYENNDTRYELSYAEFAEGSFGNNQQITDSEGEVLRINMEHPYASISKTPLADGTVLVSYTAEDGTTVKIGKIDPQTNQFEIIYEHPIEDPSLGMVPVEVDSNGVGFFVLPGDSTHANRVMKVEEGEETILKGGHAISEAVVLPDHFAVATQAESVETASFASNNSSNTENKQAYVTGVHQNSCPDIIQHPMGVMSAWIDTDKYVCYAFYNTDGTLSGMRRIEGVQVTDDGLGGTRKGKLVELSYNPNTQDKHAINFATKSGIIQVRVNGSGDPLTPEVIGHISRDKLDNGALPLTLHSNEELLQSTRDAHYDDGEQSQFTNTQITVESVQTSPPTPTPTHTPSPTPSPSPTPTYTPSPTPQPQSTPSTPEPNPTPTRTFPVYLPAVMRPDGTEVQATEVTVTIKPVTLSMKTEKDEDGETVNIYTPEN